MNLFRRAFRMMPFRKTLTVLAVLLLVVLLAGVVVFPGQQTPMALTYATGWNVKNTQAEIDRLEDLAIHKQPFTDEDKQFLFDLYSAGAKGGRITGVVPNASRLVSRYLDRSGEDLKIDADLVRHSHPVRLEIQTLKRQIALALARRHDVEPRYESPTFYMGDPNDLDAVASLYFGRLIVTPYVNEEGQSMLAWRAEIPWVWPTYDELFEKYGDHHAQNFGLPNLRSQVFGPRYMLRVDDGLGGHLPALGLAQPFLAYAEWEEVWDAD
ncbi:MAG: hypothetical protein AAF593_17090 [Planctomycetota bacterium]